MPCISVATARPVEWQTALDLLLADLPPDERHAQIGSVLHDLSRGAISLDGLLLARREGQPVGAAFYTLQPGASAFVWPPVVRSPADGDAVGDALLHEVARQLDARGVTLAQSLLESQQTDARAMLQRNGFPHVADLVYLQRPLDVPLPPRADWTPERVTFMPNENTTRFAILLERTYVGSRDCPDLQGKRRGADALESHRASGEFHPRLWNIYRVAGEDVGVLLLNDHPDHDAWEVVYIGVVPEMRGRGYGRAMLLDGLHAAQAAGRKSVLLAVDGGNHYARRLYDALGFAGIAVRAVHVRVTSADAAGVLNNS